MKKLVLLVALLGLCFPVLGQSKELYYNHITILSQDMNEVKGEVVRRTLISLDGKGKIIISVYDEEDLILKIVGEKELQRTPLGDSYLVPCKDENGNNVIFSIGNNTGCMVMSDDSVLWFHNE